MIVCINSKVSPFPGILRSRPPSMVHQVTPRYVLLVLLSTELFCLPACGRTDQTEFTPIPDSHYRVEVHIVYMLERFLTSSI